MPSDEKVTHALLLLKPANQLVTCNPRFALRGGKCRKRSESTEEHDASLPGVPAGTVRNRPSLGIHGCSLHQVSDVMVLPATYLPEY